MSKLEEYEKYYDQFNDEFFEGKLPVVPIKIQKTHDSKAVGEFVYNTKVEISGSENYTLDFFELKKKIKNDEASPIEEEAWQNLKDSAYISLPKETLDRGKYAGVSVLIHEMIHCWDKFVSKGMDKDPHGKNFRDKVDEINKKSNNEWRVGYTELDQALNSDDVLDYRPTDYENNTYYIMYKGDRVFKNVRGTDVLYVSQHLGRKKVKEAYRNGDAEGDCFVAAFVVDNEHISKADLEASWGSSKKPYLDNTDPTHLDKDPNAFYDWANQVASLIEDYCDPVVTYKVSRTGVIKLRDNPYSNKKFEESEMFQEAYVLSKLQEMTGDSLYEKCYRSFQDESSAINVGVRFGMFVRLHADWFDPSPETVVKNCILRGLEENDRRREGKESEAIPITSLLIRIAYFMAGVEMEKGIHKMYIDISRVDEDGYQPYVNKVLNNEARFNGFHFGASDTLTAKEQDDIFNKVYKTYFDIVGGNEEEVISEDEFKQSLGL